MHSFSETGSHTETGVSVWATRIDQKVLGIYLCPLSPVSPALRWILLIWTVVLGLIQLLF